MVFLEGFVARRRVFQGKAVADEEFSVDLPLSDTVEKIVAIALHMRLAALHLQSFFHDGAQRDLVSHAAINAGNRNPPSFAAGENRLFERRDRKSVVLGKRLSVRVDLGGRRIIKKTT